MINIAALTMGVQEAGSRFRVRQYIAKLREADINVTEFPAKIDYSIKLPGPLGRIRQRYIFPVSAAWIGIKAISRIEDVIKSNRFDAVWVNRALAPNIFLEKFLTRPLIYDVDDAIWINNERIIGKIATKADVILAGNNFIAENLRKYNSNIVVIPTAIDTSRFKPVESKTEDVFSIVWTGSKDTLQYLLSVEKPLSVFLKKEKKSRLTIISNVFPKFSLIKPNQVNFVPWSPESEVSGIQQSNVGIMPLFNGEWEKGKCSFKMLQYMSCGIPVIVSPVGMNNLVLSKANIGFHANTEDDWLSALNFLYKNPLEASKMGKEGRLVIADNYSQTIVTNQLIAVFRNL